MSTTLTVVILAAGQGEGMDAAWLSVCFNGLFCCFPELACQMLKGWLIAPAQAGRWQER